MPRALRPRFMALMAAILVHAAFLVALLSALQVGTSAMRAPPNALLERASPVSAVPAVIFLVLHRHAAELSDEPLNLPGFVNPNLEPIPIALPLPDTGWGIENATSVPRSAVSHPGTVGVRCEVHIHQDAQGHVQAIDLGACTENAAWQRALLRAIAQAASTATPSPAARPPELTLTLDTNRISPPALAHLLSQSSTSQSAKIPVRIATWGSQ